MSPEEADLFDIDLRKIDLLLHAKYFQYGIGKFYNNLDILPPDAPLQQILQLNSINFGQDLKSSLQSTAGMRNRDLKEFTQAVLNAPKFQAFLELCFQSNEGKQMSLNSLKNLPSVRELSSNMIQLDHVTA